MVVKKIISGGQTGVDRAALDVARRLQIPYGGWIPKGRVTEDGPLSPVYDQMEEMGTADYEARTEQNVIDSDATLILSRSGGLPLTGGTEYTRQVAEEKHQKPVLHVDLELQTAFEAASSIVSWIEDNHSRNSEIFRLNVAGPRASKDPKIYQDTIDILTLVFSTLDGN